MISGWFSSSLYGLRSHLIAFKIFILESRLTGDQERSTSNLGASALANPCNRRRNLSLETNFTQDSNYESDFLELSKIYPSIRRPHNTPTSRNAQLSHRGEASADERTLDGYTNSLERCTIQSIVDGQSISKYSRPSRSYLRRLYALIGG